MKFPVAPLLAAVDIKCLEKFGELHDSDVATYLGVTKGVISKWRRIDGCVIGLQMADNCSREVGLSLDIIWPLDTVRV